MTYRVVKNWQVRAGGQKVSFESRYSALRGAIRYAQAHPGVEAEVWRFKDGKLVPYTRAVTHA